MPIWKFAANESGETVTEAVAGGISSTLSLSADIQVGTGNLVLSGQINSASQLASSIVQSTGLYSYSETRNGPYTCKTLSGMPCLVDGAVNSTASPWVPANEFDYSFGIDQAISQRLAQLTVHALCYAIPGPEESARPNTWVGGRTFSLYSSDDNLNWTHVEDFSNPQIESDTDYEFWFVLVLANPQTARYFKIVTSGSVYVRQDALNSCSIQVSEIDTDQVSTTAVSADAFEFLSTLGSIIISDSVDGLILGNIEIRADTQIGKIFFHGQVFSPPAVIITREALIGRISLQETLDAIELLGGGTLELADPADSISFSAEMGTAATLLLSDPRDAFASLNGGKLTLEEPTASLFLCSQPEVVAGLTLTDPKNTAEFDALPGSIGTISLLDMTDGMEIEGLPSSIGALRLHDSNDTMLIQALPGGTAALSLFDSLDSVDIEGCQELRGELSLKDAPDAFMLKSVCSSRFSGHIIQYQKAWY